MTLLTKSEIISIDRGMTLISNMVFMKRRAGCGQQGNGNVVQSLDKLLILNNILESKLMYHVFR